ncbi:hypothetical protein IOD14_22365 [Streptomyces sp. A2-16]|uniref:hypothetical protein n=1 Tax=Streptomyces sp. A2-16 TaxID=2781734 RepID=UPI001BAF7DD7|nr:hypothetical protein [Streptomyces sp. A2-16]QUC63793.1 hypothetical protein IOD14_22365 [Streptomyces sp. A2-16]
MRTFLDALIRVRDEVFGNLYRLGSGAVRGSTQATRPSCPCRQLLTDQLQDLRPA